MTAWQSFWFSISRPAPMRGIHPYSLFRMLCLTLFCLIPLSAYSATIPSLLSITTPHKAAATASEPAASEPSATSEPISEPLGSSGYKGLLGKLGGQIDNLGSQIKKQLAPLQLWSLLLVAAKNDLFLFVLKQHTDTLLDLMSILSIWVGVAWLIYCLMTWLRKRYHIAVTMPVNPTTRELIIFSLRKIAPWVGSFILALVAVHNTQMSFGKILGLLISYSVVAGAIFATLCVVLFSVSSGEHRRVAARILMHRHLWLLWLIGSLSALGDASNDERIIDIVGPALSSLCAALVGLMAALSIGLYIVLNRRLIGHLIFIRSLDKRLHSKTFIEALELLARIWHIPILLLLGFSIIRILVSVDHPGHLLALIVVSMGLLLLTTFISMLIRRKLHFSNTSAVAQRKRSIYATRLIIFCYTLLSIAVWMTSAEVIARLWGWSFRFLSQLTIAGHTLGSSIKSISLTVLISWIIWTMLDIAVQEGFSPSRAKGKKTINARALTILPLARNALAVMVIVITGTIILANMGIDITPLLAGAGVIGIAVGFGAQSLVQDVITGLFILLEDSISVGDYIEVGSNAGTVENLSIRTVRLRDVQGSVHSIPFSQIKIIRNYARGFSYAVFDIGVAYSTDMDKAFRVIRETGAELAQSRFRRELVGALEILGIQSFGDNAVVIRARQKTRPLQQWEIGRAFNLILFKKFNQHGIEFPFPQRDIHVTMVDGGVPATIVPIRESASNQEKPTPV